MNTIFNKNISAIIKKNKELANAIIKVKGNNDYSDTITVKNGMICPRLKNGHLLHSKYSPERETSNMFNGHEEFILFAGIGSGIQIRYFLENFNDKVCCITESSVQTWRSLLELIDMYDILKNKRVIILPTITNDNFENQIIKNYLPAIHGSFTVKTLRPWSQYFQYEFNILTEKIQSAMKTIKADFSVQAHFGKIWIRNILLNLQLADKIDANIPVIDNSKTALILGAGPSLSSDITKIKKNRAKYVLFSTDTAYSVLTQNNIIPEFYIGIDPQTISYLHLTNLEKTNTIGIFDLCSNSIVAREFYKSGNTIIFTSGGHPLTTTLSQFPFMDTSSGTVAISALDAAKRLGFSKTEFAGLDFAYTDGNPYSKGTYLSKIYHSIATKLIPAEKLFMGIMFRSPVYTNKQNKKITYRRSVLDSYANNFNNYKFDNQIWNKSDFSVFNYQIFFENLLYDLQNKNIEKLTSFFPFLAYHKSKNTKILSNLMSFDLVINEILKYNKL